MEGSVGLVREQVCKESMDLVCSEGPCTGGQCFRATLCLLLLPLFSSQQEGNI